MVHACESMFCQGAPPYIEVGEPLIEEKSLMFYRHILIDQFAVPDFEHINCFTSHVFIATRTGSPPALFVPA